MGPNIHCFKLDGIKVYARCIHLIRKTENKGSEGHHKAILNAFHLAPVILTPAHSATMRIPDDYSTSLREHIRILMHNAIEELCFLADEMHLPTGQLGPAADYTASLRCDI